MSKVNSHWLPNSNNRRKAYLGRVRARLLFETFYSAKFAVID